MSRPSSDASERVAPSKNASGSDPLRPSDHVDGVADEITSPALGVVGWLRWGWRQLTSMRTALILLLLLAIAAVPGSIFPQRMANPNGVVQWKRDNPDLFPVLDAVQLFDVYQSAWFSAIYILLFVSLIGCILPRTKHHWNALRSRPPRTPARLSRLDDHVSQRVEGEGDAQIGAELAIDEATTLLKGQGYRVERYDGRGVFSVSAERGYLRETGNLVFHAALVGVLLAVGIGGGFAYTGQRILIEGQTVVNALVDYSSMNRGRFVGDQALTPYAMRLDSFDVTYQDPLKPGAGQAGDFAANVTVTKPDGTETAGAIRVNHPLSVAGERIYLLGNGYAPTITVRDADGDVVFSESVPFIPQDTNMTSMGVVKIADGMPQQLGMLGFFYPTKMPLDTGALTSVYGDLLDPMLTLNVYAGDLGINEGVPRNVYELDPSGMTQLTGGKTGTESIKLAPGETADLPDGLGTVTFEDETPEGADRKLVGYTQAVKRFASLQTHSDGSALFVLGFAILMVAGLLTALFVPRRRVWVKATPADDGSIELEYAALARGDDPTLAAAIEQLRTKHLASLQK